MGLSLLALALGAATAALWGTALAGTFARAGATVRNYRGRAVPRSGGVAFVLAVAAATAVALAVAPGGAPAALMLLAAVGFGFLGLVDDVAGDRRAGGLAGHWRALTREGRLTTGLVKAVFGLVLAGGVAALAAPAGNPAGWAVATGVIALSANAVNLLDLRPGRALKVALAVLAPAVAAAPPDARPAVAAALGAAFALLPADLAGRTMLGDTGSNALGAAAGLALLWSTGPAGRLAALAVLALLHVVSERIPVSRIIEASPALRALDRWGRPPEGPPPP